MPQPRDDADLEQHPPAPCSRSNPDPRKHAGSFSPPTRGHCVLVVVHMYMSISVYSCMKLKLFHPTPRYSSPSNSL